MHPNRSPASFGRALMNVTQVLWRNRGFLGVQHGFGMWSAAVNPICIGIGASPTSCRT
jgi:hypothetical protein